MSNRKKRGEKRLRLAQGAAVMGGEGNSSHALRPQFLAGAHHP